MAKLAEFYGIIIRMRSELGESHHWPHFHARYADYEAVYAVIDGEIEKIAGSLPRRQHRRVMKWAQMNVAGIMNAWNRLQRGEQPDPIDPLE